jgi:tetratricopeptide (TPR) repeat protein
MLLVTIEGLGAADTGCGGNPLARTPHLDRLARRGLQAERAVSPATTPRVGLASLLTGVSPAEHGLVHEDFALDVEATTVASLLAKRGVRTGAFAGTAAADRRQGLGRGFVRHDPRFTEDSRVGEPWREQGFRGSASLVREWAEWRAEEPEEVSLGWLHLAEAKRGDVAGADHGLGLALRSAGPGAFVVVSSPTAASPSREVPFLVAGPGVTPELRPGTTPTQEAARLLAAAFAGERLLAEALAAPPNPSGGGGAEESAPPDASLPAEVIGHLASARAHDLASRVSAAREGYAAAVAAEPRLIGARARGAELARRAGEIQASVDEATALLARVPEHPEARVLVSRVLIAQKDERALPLLAGVLAAAPHHPSALTVRADLSLQGGDGEAALRDLRLALAAAGENQDALIEVALGLSRAGMHADAVRTAQVAVGRDRNPRARYTLAFVMEKAERYPESVHEYSALIGEHPEYLPPYRNLGALMARDGELQRAIDLWERGLELHPEDPSLRANLEAARAAVGLGTLGG